MMLMPRRTFDLFDDFFDDTFFRRSTKMSLMQSDIKEKEKEYLIEINMPGYDKKDIELSLDNGYLIVNAKSSKNLDDSNENYIHKERFFGECNRRFYVGDTVSEKDIKAQLKNGILTLSVPKKDAKEIEKRKFISIE